MSGRVAGSLPERLTWRIRWVAVRGAAAGLAGVVVLGLGGRLVMLVSRLLHPDAVGRTTESGNVIGEFTLAGTVALVGFSGLGGGLAAGVVWVAVKRWIPAHPLAVGLAATAIGGFFVVDADNQDFVILRDPTPDLVLLLGLVFLFGVVLEGVDPWLDDRLPDGGGIGAIVGYSLAVLVALPLTVPTFGNFFSREFCFCEDPPVWTGVFLVATAATTVWWWAMHLRGRDAVPGRVRVVARSALALTVVAGGVHLSRHVVAIL